MISAINHITLTTKNINAAFDFYKNILGFKPLCKWHGGAYFLVGETWFCLNFDENCTATLDYTHIAFNVEQNAFEEIRSQIIAAGVTIFKDNKSENDSLYFLDRDGHKLELHVGNWQTRIAAKKQNPGNWQEVEFYI